jgi:hypothetical protein
MEPRSFSRLGITAALAIAALLGFSIQPAVLAEGNGGQTTSLNGQRAVCTNATATGTYGYRMNGVIVGLGPFLVNGIYTHHPDGTMDADVRLVVGNQTFSLAGTGGTFHTKGDCTGSGRFSTAALGDVTYNFVVTDNGDQIELLNTDPNIVLQGISRRISKPGKEPHCANDMVLGSYGYRLEGSLPGVPNAAAIGLVSQTLENLHDDVGIIRGRELLKLMGAPYELREFTGTFSVGSNCRGTGSFTDATNRKINYVFTAVNDGDMLFLQGDDPGDAIWGVAQRVR